MPLFITIKAIPNSGKQGFFRDKSGILKCHLKNAPEDGKANKELITLLSKSLKTPITNINIVTGATQRTKIFKIETNISQNEAYELLGVYHQLTIK